MPQQPPDLIDEPASFETLTGERVVEPVVSARDRDERWIVQLIEVDVIGLQVAQARLEIASEVIPRSRGRLRRDDNVAPDLVHGETELFLAVGI